MQAWTKEVESGQGPPNQYNDHQQKFQNLNPVQVPFE